MQYIDFERLEKIDARSYQEQQPFPWTNPYGLLTESGYARLVATLPSISQFESSFGMARKNGQHAHDRYILEYHDRLELSSSWQDCIAELCSPRYKENLCRLLDQRSISLNFHWHYTPNGCVVSPHADSVRKAGSHIFYFNTDDDWDLEWGGQTVLLDDGGAFSFRSSPRFEDFRREVSAVALGNHSLLFTRTDHAWHGVRPVVCPADKLRKVFIVVINRNRPLDRVRRIVGRRRLYDY